MIHHSFKLDETTIKQGVGLVLSGGGGKGAYEIGVWRALDEYGVIPNIRAISGTSVGALNAALFAQGDLTQAIRVWQNISPEAVMTINDLPPYLNLTSSIFTLLTETKFFHAAESIHNWITRRFADQGILSKKGLSNLIDDAIDPLHITSFIGPVYVAAYDIAASRVEYFNLKEHSGLSAMKDRLLASASIPIVFGKTYIDGKLYWDGGLPQIGDNTPIKPLYEEGYRNLIVVHLSREEPIDRNKFSGCNIIEIMPQQDLGGMVSGTMNFNPETAWLNIQRGYKDAVRILEPFFRTGASLTRIQSAFRQIAKEQESFTSQQKMLNDRLKKSGEDIDAMLSNLNKGDVI